MPASTVSAEQKLDVLTAWEEAGNLFTERERAALALTEAITELGNGHVSDAVYAGPQRFSPSGSSVRSSRWP